MRRHARLPALLACAAALVPAALLSGCGSSAASADGRLPVVAGEDTWGSVAAAVGGARVQVTSLIASPSADPHEFTATAADALAVHGAAVVVQNGAGYDDFVTQLLGASGTSPTLLVVAHLAHATGADPNPHFWYDLATVRTVAATMAAAFAHARPADRAYFATRLSAFDASLDPVAAVVATIAQRFAGSPVAYTERVPGYLCAAARLDVVTPPAFARSIEAGIEPSLAATDAMDALVTQHRIRVLLENVQTVSPVTTQLVAEAHANHLPVVGVAETLPADVRSFVGWQLAQDRALLAALER
jgi:zinc/manganese transport system substrate-binding protein